jgi:hypothetical protein
VAVERAQLLYARGKYDMAARAFREIFDHSTDVARRQWLAGVLRDIALAHNDVLEGRRWATVWTEGALQRSIPAAALAGALDQAWITLWFDRDTSSALREVATALGRHPLAAIPPLDRPYDKLIRVYAWGGRPARARIALSGYDSAIGTPARPRARALGSRYRGEIELAEGKYKDAMASFRAADSTACVTCLFPLMAITFERMGARDSARVFWRRYLATPEIDRFETDARFWQHALKARSSGAGPDRGR